MWLIGCLAEKGSHSVSLIWRAGVGRGLWICWRTLLEDTARLHHSAWMWQWGNSVSACCVMSQRFLTYCEGDERRKKASNGFSVWWKGAPADGASVSLFLRNKWQRMREEGRKNGWAWGRIPRALLGRYSADRDIQRTFSGNQIFINCQPCNHKQCAGVDHIDHTAN